MNVVYFGKYHGRASAPSGYKSGLSSCLGIPDTRSTAITRSGGTSTHCEIACAEMPSGSANRARPPADSMARRKASDFRLMAGRLSIALIESQAMLHCSNKGKLYDDPMLIGGRIKHARKRLGLTQKEIAESLGITIQAVSQWESSGEIDRQRLPALRRILKVSWRWLMEGQGPIPPADSIESALDDLDEADQAAVAALVEALRKRRGKAA